jgi:hypothetical protein
MGSGAVGEVACLLAAAADGRCGPVPWVGELRKRRLAAERTDANTEHGAAEDQPCANHMRRCVCWLLDGLRWRKGRLVKHAPCCIP